MADVEAMYHQFQVPENHQSFLKFLWWENHDIDTEPHDYVMCAHVFGATLSANCLNLCLVQGSCGKQSSFLGSSSKCSSS